MKRALFGLMLLAVPAWAAPGDDVYATYAKGDYEAAARAGEAAHTAASLTMAARAVLADEALRDTPCMDCLRRAEKLSRAAIAMDPHNAFAQLWLAASLGYQGRIMGTVKARLADIPNQSKTALDAALAADPNNGYVVSAVGGWNLAVVKAGGAFLARQIFGATEAQGMTMIDRAVKLDPGNVSVRFQNGLVLADFDADKYHDRILTELRAALSAHADTVYEKRIQERANILLGLVTHGSQDALTARVRKYSGWPD